MTILTKLDVVNDMLSGLGEAPVSTLDELHPLIASCLTKLKVANNREQSKGWWFNTELVKLSPDSGDSKIYLPTDTLKVDPTDSTLHLTQRGRRLYRLDNMSATPDVFTAPVVVQLVRLLPFEDLPAQAQLYVSYGAQLDFHRSMDGDTTKIQLLSDAFRDARVTLMAEHIRAVDANMLKRPSTLTKLHNIAFGGFHPLLPNR